MRLHGCGQQGLGPGILLTGGMAGREEGRGRFRGAAALAGEPRRQLVPGLDVVELSEAGLQPLERLDEPGVPTPVAAAGAARPEKLARVAELLSLDADAGA